LDEGEQLLADRGRGVFRFLGLFGHKEFRGYNVSVRGVIFKRFSPSSWLCMTAEYVVPFSSLFFE
jgi:hypothetical protein